MDNCCFHAAEAARLNAEDHAREEINRLRAALQKILDLNGSTGGPASLVKEFKFIAQQALAGEEIQ